LKIFITHFHGDHLIGLPGLLFRFSLIERNAPVMIFGPRNLFIYVYLHRKILGLRAGYPIKIIEIDEENNKLIIFNGLDNEMPYNEIEIKDNIIFENKKYMIKYALVEHSITSFAYAFIEKLRSGKFNPERARELGIPESRLWKKLQDGKTITFEGNEIDPLKEGIVGPKRPGRKISYSGDTMPCESLIELGKDSDILIHEATYARELAEIAKEKKHSTSIDAANDAMLMSAKQLILTHISTRYQEDAKNLLEEAKKIFSNTILAEDLMHITLK